MIEVKGCDIERVMAIVVVEKRRETRGNFSEVNIIFQLAGYCFRRKVLLFRKVLGMIQ